MIWSIAREAGVSCSNSPGSHERIKNGTFSELQLKKLLLERVDTKELILKSTPGKKCARNDSGQLSSNFRTNVELMFHVKHLLMMLMSYYF